MFVTFNMAAGQRVEFREAFDFIRIMDAASSLNVEFFRDGREVDEANGVGVGYSEKFAKACDMLAITNGATAQTVSFATRLGSAVAYDRPPTGNVIAESKTTNSATWQMRSIGPVAANLCFDNQNRRVAIIQNQSQTGVLWIGFGGNVPGVNNGYRLGPGETLYQDGPICWKAILGYADTAGTQVYCGELNA